MEEDDDEEGGEVGVWCDVESYADYWDLLERRAEAVLKGRRDIQMEWNTMPDSMTATLKWVSGCMLLE